MELTDPSAAPLYLQIAERLAASVRTGILKRGERLPSVRELAAQHGVSLATAVQAYRWLEDAHLVEARPRSGYFVSKPPAKLLEPQQSRPSRKSQAVRLDELGEQVKQMSNQPGMVSFGAAYPSPEMFDAERLRRAMTRVVLRHRDLLRVYPMGHGQAEARRAVARHALGLGCALKVDDLVMTNGCLEAITLCLKSVTAPGDVVALESPTHFSFLEILQCLRLRALEIPTHARHGMSMDALQLALDTQPVKAVLVVPTLSNPLGSCMPVAERKRLAQMAAHYQVPVIEDVLCNDLAEQEDKRRAVRSFDSTGHVMLCGSFSKTLAPGLRLGWVDGGRWGAQLRKFKSVESGAQTAVMELTLAELLNQAGSMAAFRALRASLATRVDVARSVMADAFPKGTRVSDPAGGYMLWVEMPAGLDSLALYEACLAENICIAPGLMFSPTARFRHCVRLCVGGHWGPEHLAALRRIGALAIQQLDVGASRLAA